MTAEPESLQAQVLRIVSRHPAGRRPGLSPDALSSLTQLPLVMLGQVVGKLVQEGKLVRDAWLVRLPDTEDLLPWYRSEVANTSGRTAIREERTGPERRAIGDRRSLGERRLFDRRQ